MQAALADDLREYAGKRWPSGNAKFRKGRLADLLGFSERRVRSFWEAKAAAPRDHEIEAIKALIGQKEEADGFADIALAKRIADLEAQVATLAALLAGDTLAAQGRAAHRQGGGASGGSHSVPRRRADD